MHNRPYRDKTVFYRIVDAVGKLMNEITSDISFDNSPSAWVATDRVNRRLNFCDEPLGKTCIDRQVMMDRRGVFGLCFGVEAEFHFLSNLRARLSTSSPSRILSGWSAASLRLSAMAARWARSMVGSMSAAMLSTIFSTRLARDAGESCRASWRRSFTLTGRA